MKTVCFIEKGQEIDHRRIGDHLRTVNLYRCFESGGLLYGYLDRFNIISIAKEDIVSIIEYR